MKRFLLTAAGRDRPGLVAAVSKILFERGCNLEDSAMTRLQGEFAILLIFSGPAKAAALEKSLKTLGRKAGLAVHLKALAGRKAKVPPATADGVLISVYGADRPGIVYRVASLVAAAKVNISDLSTHRTESPGKSGYILYIEGEAPPGLAPSALEKTLRDGIADLGVTLQVKPLPSSAL